jgi:hypothetical protein
VAPLAGLTALQTIDLDRTKVSDLTPMGTPPPRAALFWGRCE